MMAGRFSSKSPISSAFESMVPAFPRRSMLSLSIGQFVTLANLCYRFNLRCAPGRSRSNLVMIYQLAQINVSRLVAPLDDPKIAGFVAQLELVNALADQAPGFVGRLNSESGNATDIAYNDDPFVIVNMSVWESIEALH